MNHALKSQKETILTNWSKPRMQKGEEQSSNSMLTRSIRKQELLLQDSSRKKACDSLVNRPKVVLTTKNFSDALSLTLMKLWFKFNRKALNKIIWKMPFHPAKRMNRRIFRTRLQISRSYSSSSPRDYQVRIMAPAEFEFSEDNFAEALF